MKVFNHMYVFIMLIVIVSYTVHSFKSGTFLSKPKERFTTVSADVRPKELEDKNTHMDSDDTTFYIDKSDIRIIEDDYLKERWYMLDMLYIPGEETRLPKNRPNAWKKMMLGKKSF